MNKYLLTLLSWSAFAVAQTGPQPLHFSNITFFPQGCGDNPTFNLKATASGGTPAADGTYTYQIEGQPSQVARIAQFNGLDATPNLTPTKLTVTDSTGSSVTYSVNAGPSQSGSVSMTIDSLPLGDGPGCITLSISDPNFLQDPRASFSVTGFPITLGKGVKSVTQAPFQVTFSAFSNELLQAGVLIFNDCIAPEGSFFTINFPFPPGQGNTMKKYLFNKYCSCALLATTVPAG